MKVEMDEVQLASYVRRLQHPVPDEPTEADVSAATERMLELIKTICQGGMFQLEKDELQDLIENYDPMVRYVALHRQAEVVEAAKRGDLTWWKDDEAWWKGEM